MKQQNLSYQKLQLEHLKVIMTTKYSQIINLVKRLKNTQNEPKSSNVVKENRMSSNLLKSCSILRKKTFVLLKRCSNAKALSSVEVRSTESVNWVCFFPFYERFFTIHSSHSFVLRSVPLSNMEDAQSSTPIEVFFFQRSSAVWFPPPWFLEHAFYTFMWALVHAGDHYSSGLMGSTHWVHLWNW